uniref:Uncharacterized protein n=1 Tax=viral metagenome TaxID=1070528 RepID=A0A6C0D7J0_9ZZZZ
MVTTLMFFQDLFGFLKNGQKKCPKLKSQNTFWKRKSLKYNKSPKQLKENPIMESINLFIIFYINE